jgi:hypothetical protein
MTTDNFHGIDRLGHRFSSWMAVLDMLNALANAFLLEPPLPDPQPIVRRVGRLPCA